MRHHQLNATDDTVHLGDHALYLGKMPGHWRINISSRVGDRQPLTSTGLGKALMLDHAESYWTERPATDHAEGATVAAISVDLGWVPTTGKLR
jgi:DNA-binding IclR family transcriptional regulator